MTEQQLADMGRQATQMQRNAVALWEQAIQTMQADSVEYRTICTMGEQVQDVYFMLRAEAKKQGWTPRQINQVFGLETCSTFV